MKLLKMLRVVLPTICLFLVGCAGPEIKLSSGAASVKIAKSDPADNYKEIGPITASDGSGCGMFGYLGTYDRAVITLKNIAYRLGGDIVQIFTMKEPHLRGECFDNTYTISGTLFKKISDAPSPLPIIEKSSKSNVDKLRELKSLLDSGVITTDEFNSQKRKILESGI